MEQCFNEAAANSPRKRGVWRGPLAGAVGFNEAAANSPRKLLGATQALGIDLLLQ